ncbi:tRNA threonylcarbamoyladenosine biosynthesis protein TsaB [Mariprofundus micogutta]|uniref:tRNA threonylcarbamoyladenosine biosynthesis protein TsaB n=1 Tax=Mariprofundus micogutta TaxID=1921010 RepID=A0A1L8CMS8_9PROT|nr:tRNA (adenosine(37)-N6)-threonylcarbamoyltransferase complex dimerization subunit type 1 TsaB [Mariprofundus micogutta]GAV20220.1 tRNA threonylcarbamoyladenosine biosynthesis protein TsaB [Mariprofundus micogutta]
MIDSKNILALDTAFGEISAAILKDGEPFLTRCDSSTDGKTRSTTIVPILANLLAEAELSWEELDILALGAGPGAFTGLRVAAATLAGINSGLKLPILHLSSLAITARQAVTSDELWVIEDARAGEAFAGCYAAGENIHADRCITWQEVDSLEIDQFACHNEPAINMNAFKRVQLLIPRSAALLAETEYLLSETQTGQLPQYPEPIYLQRSQAEKNANVQ